MWLPFLIYQGFLVDIFKIFTKSKYQSKIADGVCKKSNKKQWPMGIRQHVVNSSSNFQNIMYT